MYRSDSFPCCQSPVCVILDRITRADMRRPANFTENKRSSSHGSGVRLPRHCRAGAPVRRCGRRHGTNSENEEALNVVAFDQEPVEAIVDWEAAKGVWLLRQESRTNAKEVGETCFGERAQSKRNVQNCSSSEKKKDTACLSWQRTSSARWRRNAIVDGGKKSVFGPMESYIEHMTTGHNILFRRKDGVFTL